MATTNRCVECRHPETDEFGEATHTGSFCWVDGCDKPHHFRAEAKMIYPAGPTSLADVIACGPYRT